MKLSYNPSKEDIENLSQLDRIEYKLDREKIGTYFFDLTIRWGFKVIFPITLLSYFVVMLGSGSENYGTVLTRMIVPLMKLAVHGTWGAIALDISAMFAKKKAINKLNEKYFGRRSNGRRKS